MARARPKGQKRSKKRAYKISASNNPTDRSGRSIDRHAKSAKERRLGGFFSSPDLPEDLDQTSKAEASGRRSKLLTRVAGLRRMG